MTTPHGVLTPATFVESFMHGWSLPKPDAFIDYFRPHMDPDVIFIQPMLPDAHGPDGFDSLFRSMFELMPDISLTVQTWAADDDAAYIESRCTTHIGRKPTTFDVCDRFTFAEGLIVERRSYSDPLPVILATLRRPSAWPRISRSRRI